MTGNCGCWARCRGVEECQFPHLRHFRMMTTMTAIRNPVRTIVLMPMPIDGAWISRRWNPEELSISPMFCVFEPPVFEPPAPMMCTVMRPADYVELV